MVLEYLQGNNPTDGQIVKCRDWKPEEAPPRGLYFPRHYQL